MNKKLIGWIVVAIVVVLACWGILNFGRDSASTPKQNVQLRVGAAIAMTGYGAAFGESEANAIHLLKRKYPTAQFFIEDNKSDSKAGLLAVSKLINVHNVDIIYCDLTTVANAVVSLTKERSVVLIAAVYLADLLDRSPYAVRNLPRGLDESRLLLSHLTTHYPDAKTVAAVGSNDEFGRSSLADFTKAASIVGVTVISQDVIPDAEAQIASFAQKLTASRPDAIYAASLMPSLGLFIRDVRVAGFTGVILTTDAFTYPYIRSAAGDYAKDTVYVDFPKTNAATRFADEYKAEFHKDFAPTAALCYDGLSIIMDTCRESPIKTPAQVVSKGLEGKMHEGIYGDVVVRGREIIYPLEIRVVK
jgi:branched-chain amino acid transport system substrate-binding protein